MYSWEIDEEEEEEEAGRDSFTGVQLIIFLIDATKDMMRKLEGDNEELTAFQKSLSCVHSMMKNKIFNSPGDRVAVLTYGNSPKKSSNMVDGEFQTVRQLMELSQPCSDNILRLEEFTDGEAGSRLFEAEFQPGDRKNVRLNEALWQCQTVFYQHKGTVGNKTLILMTNTDDPHCGDRDLDRMARTKAGDLHSQNIFLDVVPVGSTGFKYDRLYSDLIKLADGTAPLNKTTEDLADTLIKRTNVKRSNGKYQLDLGGAIVEVSAYNMVTQRKKPARQKLAANNNQSLKSKRTWVHPETQSPLLPSEMNRYLSYGGRVIKFTQDEHRSLNNFEPDVASLQLFGFKPVSTLKFSKFIRSAHFLYPLDEKVVFSALLSSCLKKNVMAICKFKSRPTSGVNFVGLVPQQEEKSEEGHQIEPPGFHVVYLLYADDRRQVPLVNNKIEHDPEAVETAKEVISKLKLKKFSPVENCSVQTHMCLIEAHALRR